jgi:hypothetical protein
MNQLTTASRNQLRSIARRMMTERGLLPDLSSAALSETAAIAEVPTDLRLRVTVAGRNEMTSHLLLP